MKLVTFRVGDKDRLGVVQGERVVDIGRLLGWLAKRQIPEDILRQPSFPPAVDTLLGVVSAPADMVALLNRGEAWRQALAQVLQVLSGLRLEAAVRGLGKPLQKVRLRPPLPRPNKIVCLGRNYAAHARERGGEVPSQPLYFAKFNNTICGPGDPIVLPPNPDISRNN